MHRQERVGKEELASNNSARTYEDIIDRAEYLKEQRRTLPTLKLNRNGVIPPSSNSNKFVA